MKKYVVLPIIAAAAALVFAACGPKQAPTQTQTEQTQLPEKIENDPVQQQEEIPEDDVIENIYGDLTFPGMWTDRVQSEVEEDGSDVRIRFFCMVGEQEANLFTLCYGTVPEDGFQMGSLLTSGDVVVPVSVVMHPIVPQEAWSEEQTNELYTLQESVNDLLVQLQQDPAFTAGQ